MQYTQLQVYNLTLGYTQTATGTSSPLFVQNLSSGTDHKCYIITKLDNDATLVSTSASYSITTPNLGFSTFSVSLYSDIGTSTDGYTIYTFKSTSPTTPYTINYTSSSSIIMYVLAVGGGGGGGKNNGGGGGAGAVVQKAITIPAGSDTISITVGAGDTNVLGSGLNNSQTGTGSSTYFTFSSNSTLSITAGGGGRGTTYGSSGNAGSSDGGSGSGGGMDSVSTGYGSAVTTTTQSTNNSYTIYANNGGTGYNSSTKNSGGGGGAGTSGKGATELISSHYGNGGDGVKCTLNGIKNYGSYGTYYWGGGGGGVGYSRAAGNGGLGGGGGGLCDSGGSIGYADTNGINTGTDGASLNTSANVSSGVQIYGNAGANTGGGGGAGSSYTSGGAGGSGIVVISFKI